MKLEKRIQIFGDELSQEIGAACQAAYPEENHQEISEKLFANAILQMAAPEQRERVFSRYLTTIEAHSDFLSKHNSTCKRLIGYLKNWFEKPPEHTLGDSFALYQQKVMAIFTKYAYKPKTDDATKE